MPLINFNEWKSKKTGQNEDFNYFDRCLHHEINTTEPYIPGKKWKDCSQEQKINILIQQRFEMPRFLEYVSKHRFYKQFDPDVMIDTYPIWVEKMLRDGKVKFK